MFRFVEGAEIGSLLATPELPALGPGPRPGVWPAKDLQDTIAGLSGISGDTRGLVLGTILLWHDHLDAAHEIAQGIETQDGSYLHAIMHRREPDYSNAKYWFRRVGRHACYSKLAKHVAIDPELGKKLAPNGEWDAFAFVDACEAASRRSSTDSAKRLREIQAAEIRTFLDYLIPSRDTSA